MKKNYTYIDLFSGCGGFSLGLSLSGWNGVFAIEKSSIAFETLKYNLLTNKRHFEWPKWLSESNHDINEILKKNIKQLIELRGKVDLVAGGPPCQGFSFAGKRLENDNRNLLVKSYIKFVEIVQPKMIFFENVTGFTRKFGRNKTMGKNYSSLVCNKLSREKEDFIGYEVYCQIIDFSEFGIPQHRKRFILVGIRKDICSLKKTSPKFFFSSLLKQREVFLRKRGLTTFQSVSEAIGDLADNTLLMNFPEKKSFKTNQYDRISSNYQALMRDGTNSLIPDSHRIPNHTSRKQNLFQKLIKHVDGGGLIDEIIKQKHEIKKRNLEVLNPNGLSPTLTSNPEDILHYSLPRILTVREYARLQSFPDWYIFKGKYTTGGMARRTDVPRYTQIGNAIPPLFAEQTGHILKELLNGRKKHL